MLRAGDLNRRAMLMAPATETDDLGGEVTVWAEVGQVWAQKTEISDAERVRAAQIGTAITTRFVVRWSSLTRQIAENWRIRCDGALHSVVHPKEIGFREGVEITANALPASA